MFSGQVDFSWTPSGPAGWRSTCWTWTRARPQILLNRTRENEQEKVPRPAWLYVPEDNKAQPPVLRGVWDNQDRWSTDVSTLRAWRSSSPPGPGAPPWDPLLALADRRNVPAAAAALSHLCSVSHQEEEELWLQLLLQEPPPAGPRPAPDQTQTSPSTSFPSCFCRKRPAELLSDHS